MRFHSRPHARLEYKRPTRALGEPDFDPDDGASLLEIAARIEALATDPEPRATWIREPSFKPSQITVLAGTFNPATTAHTGLIETAKRQGARPAAFVVAVRSVDKESVEIMSLEDRL